MSEAIGSPESEARPGKRNRFSIGVSLFFNMRPITRAVEFVANQNNPKLNQESSALFLNKTANWQANRGSQCRLYGQFDDLGVSIEWNDFELNANAVFQWSRSFHPDSLELCLNLAGHGYIHCAENTMDFEPLTAGFYAVGKNELKAWRMPGERHRFITVGFSAPFLRQYLYQCDGALHALVDKFVSSNMAPAALGEMRRLTTEQGELISQLLHPHPSQRACQLWYQGRVLQLIAEFFFERHCENPMSCTRQTRLAQERVERVVAILHRELTEPPALDKIGREVGCSPWYLSRIFSRETGMTIPQYLRKLRMECAAELLKSGKCNVTEAATEVGYSRFEPFQQSVLPNNGLLSGTLPGKDAATSNRTLRESVLCNRRGMRSYKIEIPTERGLLTRGDSMPEHVQSD